MSAKIKVAIKVRRLIEREESEGLVSQWEVKNNSIFQKDSAGKSKECYSFDHVFDPRIKNFEVFNTIARPIVDSSVGGFNGTIFAYGQTSSGKTYTMMGSRDEPGIIPLTIQYIFEAVNKVEGREFLLRASYIEIYNEKVNDLLEKGKTGLKLREVEGSVIICGLKEEVVHTPEKIVHLMKRGENIRRIGETNMNERSSRSHTIFRIIIESRIPNEGEDGVVQVSHLNLVDLAGSERVNQTGSKGDRLKEGCSINRSLFMLSHVISQLSEEQDQYVNFRDSKLTRILQSSLGGNAHTAIICAVTPASVDETASTLGFASRAIHVKNKPHVNEVLSDAALLKRYARQIAKLQTELGKTKNRNRIDEVEEIESKLQEQQRHNELLQERIDLLKEKLIGCAATDSAAVDKRRALRRRTWCGRASRKSVFHSSLLETIDEGGASMSPVFKQQYLSSSIQELADNTLFETPLEEFELQLMHAESRLSDESNESPEHPSCNVTVRKGKRQCVTFEDQAEYTVYQSKDTVEIGSQTDAFPINFHSTNTLQSTFHETPPRLLRERIKHYQKEYDELRDFTVLEKQICNARTYEELTRLEMENKHLQKSIGDMEAVILDVNCTNSKLHDENKSLKERLEKESEKCNDLTSHLRTLCETETALSERSQEIITLKKQLNMATQRIKDLENEKNDFDTVKELAEKKLKRRNEELTHSLEDALMKLEEFHVSDSVALTEDMNNYIHTLKEKDDHIAELKQNIEELTRISTSTADLRKLQDEMKILREENVVYIQELKEKNKYLEQLQQGNDQLKENDLSSHLNIMKEELNSLQESNFLYIGQLKEKEKHLEMLTKQIEKLNSEKEESLKGIQKSKENNNFHKQLKQNERFAEVDTCMSDVSRAQEEDDSVKGGHCIYVEQLREKDNYLEIMKQSTEDLDSVKEANLKYIEQLQDKDKCLELLKQQIKEQKDTGLGMQDLSRTQDELKFLSEVNFIYIEQLKAKSECLELLKRENEQLKENDYKRQLSTVQDELKLLKEQSLLYIEQLKEKDRSLEILKHQVEVLDSAKTANLKYIDELKETNFIGHKEIISLKEENFMYTEQLKQRDNYLEILTQQIEDSDSVKKSSLKYMEQLQNKGKCPELMHQQSVLQESDSNTHELSSVQDEMKSKENDNSLQTLAQQIKDFDSMKEANFKCFKQLQKDTNLEQLKQEIEELKETGLNTQELSRVQDKLTSVIESNLIGTEQLEAKGECLELLEKENDHNRELSIAQGELNEEHLLHVEQLKESNNDNEMLKQHIQDLDPIKVANFKHINELKEKNISLHKEINKLKDENSMYFKQLREKDNYLQALKQQTEELNSTKEADLKCTYEFKENNVRVQEEMNFLKEEISSYLKQLKEKDNYLKTLKQQTEDLNYAKEANLKYIDELKDYNVTVQEEMNSLKEVNSVYIKQLNEKDNYLEALKQQIEDMNSAKEVNLKYIDELKVTNVRVQEKINSLKEKTSMHSEELKEKDNCLQVLKQQIEDLNSAKEVDLKYIDEMKENDIKVQEEINSVKDENSMYIQQLKEKDNHLEAIKQQIEDLNSEKEFNLKFIDELKLNNTRMQEEINSLKEENSMYREQLMEKENYLETLKQQMNTMDSLKEANLKHIDELKDYNVTVQKDMYSLKNENSTHIKQLKENDNYLEALKRQIEDLNYANETNLKYIDELKGINVRVQEEMNFLKEENTLYNKQLKEKDNYLEELKLQIEDLNSEKEFNLKFIDELKLKNIRMQEEINSVKEENSIYREQLMEKENYLETLKQQMNTMDSVKEANLKHIDELKDYNVTVQEEMHSLKNENSTHIKQLKENDNYFEALKRQIEDLNYANETNLKYIDELKGINVRVQEEMNFLKEENTLYNKQLKEKDNYLEELKQQIEDINSAREINLKDINELNENNFRVQEEIKSLKEKTSMYSEELKEKDNYLEVLKQQIEHLNSVKEVDLKYIDEMEETNIKVQKEINSLKEENAVYNEQLKEKDNYLEARKQQLEDLNSVRETNLKCIGELKENNFRVQEEMIFLKEENSLYSEELREKDNYFELKQQIQDLNSEKEFYFKYIDELNGTNVRVQEEINSLKEKTSMHSEELKVKDNCLQVLKQQIEDLNSAKEADLKYFDEMKANNISVQEEFNSVKDENSMYIQQLKEKDNHLEALKQQIEDLNSEKEFNLKFIDELKLNNVRMQEEINSVKEENSMYREQLMEKENYLETLKQLMNTMDSVKEANLKHIDELKDYNVTVQEDVYSLKNENSTHIKQLKENDNYLEALKRQIEDLNYANETNLKYIDELKGINVRVQEEMNSLKEENTLYNEQLKEKDNYLEELKQQIEDLNSARETNLKYINELIESNFRVQEEMNSLKEKNSLYSEELREKDNYFELKQQIQDLNSEKEFNLKYIDELKGTNVRVQEEINSLKEKTSVHSEELKEKDNCLQVLKQQIEDLNSAKEVDLKYIDELKLNNIRMQEEINSVKEENSMYREQLMEKENYLETLKQQMNTMDSVKEANLKHIDELKDYNVTVQEEMYSLKNENSTHIKQLKENDNYLEALKQQIEDLNYANEISLKYIDELKGTNVRVQEEMNFLQKENTLYNEQLKEKDNYLEELKQQIEDLNSARETNLKYINELKENNFSVQEEMISLKEENSLHSEELSEKDNYFALKQQIQDLNSEKEFNSKYIDELKGTNVRVQEEIDSLKEKISMHSEELKVKDNCLQVLEQQIEDLNSVKEVDLKYNGEMKANNIRVQEEINSVKDENSMYIQQLKEKDNHLEALKLQIEDLNSEKEFNLKFTDELKLNNTRMQEEINSVKEENSMYREQLMEKENYLETLKQQINTMDSVKEASLKHIDELKDYNVTVQEEMHSLKNENSTHIKQLKENDNYFEALKRQIEDLNYANETNLKYIDELKGINVRVQEEMNSLKEENTLYNEQLKEKDNYLEELKQQIEDLNSARETNLKYIDELKENNFRVQEGMNSLKEENSTYIKQLKEKDNYLETLKQKIEDLNSVKQTNLKYIEQLQMVKYAEVLETDNNEGSQEYEGLVAQVDCCKNELPAESRVMNKSISYMSYEIESCRRAILNEVKCLKPNYDVESVSQGRLTSLFKILLTTVMEKQKELLHEFQEQVDEVHTQASECEKEYVDKDRRKDCWIRELEAEVEHLQADVTRVEDENKALKMDDKLHYLKILEQEKADLMKKVRQSDSDLAVVQIEMNRMKENMKSCNKEMAKKLEDLQLLVEEKDSLVCQLKEELESQLNNQMELETLKKEAFYLKESNAVLIERLEKMNNDNSLLLQKAEELQCALLLEKNKNQDVMTKLGSLEMELKTLSMKNCDLKEEVNANKEVHSLLLKEKERSFEMTLNLKKVTEDLENLMVEKLSWDSEKQELQANLATKQNELSSERNLRCQLEKDMSVFVKMKEETGQLDISYSQMQLKEGLKKQKELAVKNENMAVHITGLQQEVNKLSNENVNLRTSVKTLVAEKHGINSEVEDLKKQLVMCLHEKTALAADCRRMQEHMQQQQDALCSENRSAVDEKESCTESLRSESQLLNARLAYKMTGENCETEVKKLEEKLEICMEEKRALDDENEQLVTRIRGLENVLKRYCVMCDSLEKSKEALDEDKKRLVSELSNSHKRLLDAESELRELKLKTLAMTKDKDASQENSILHCCVKELQTETQSLQNRNKLLLQERQSSSLNIAILQAQCRQIETCPSEKTSVAKSSVATITDISGSCQCKELAKKVQELKLINAERNNRIGILELQIKAEDFPHRQKVKELEDGLSLYQSKNVELKTDLRRLHQMIKYSDQNCASCRRQNSLKPKHVAIQTDEIKDENFLMAGSVGSGIIREDQLMKMRIRIRELESKNEMLKELCRERRGRILELEEMLKVQFIPHNRKRDEGSDTIKVEGVQRLSSCAGSSREQGQVQHSQVFGSGPIHIQAGNKENLLDSHEALQRPRRNLYNKNYKPDLRRPLNENISGIQDMDISSKD